MTLSQELKSEFNDVKMLTKCNQISFQPSFHLFLRYCYKEWQIPSHSTDIKPVVTQNLCVANDK